MLFNICSEEKNRLWLGKNVQGNWGLGSAAHKGSFQTWPGPHTGWFKTGIQAPTKHRMFPVCSLLNTQTPIVVCSINKGDWKSKRTYKRSKKRWRKLWSILSINLQKMHSGLFGQSCIIISCMFKVVERKLIN